MRRRQPPNDESNSRRRGATNSKKRGWKDNWARIPFERKVAMFVAPVFVAVVAGFLLSLIGGSLPKANPGPSAPISVPSGSIKAEYQRRIREICSDRALLVPRYEQKAKTSAEHLQASFSSDGTAAVIGFMTDIVQILMDENSGEIGLKEQLKALSPPADLESIHNESVATWEQDIASQQRAADDLRGKLGSNFNLSDTLAFLQSYDLSTVRQQDDRLDGYLVHLAGSGCNPRGPDVPLPSL
jgi:hypothetical protein